MRASKLRTAILRVLLTEKSAIATHIRRVCKESRRWVKGGRRACRKYAFIRAKDYLTCRVVTRDIKADCNHFIKHTARNVERALRHRLKLRCGTASAFWFVRRLYCYDVSCRWYFRNIFETRRSAYINLLYGKRFFSPDFSIARICSNLCFLYVSKYFFLPFSKLSFELSIFSGGRYAECIFNKFRRVWNRKSDRCRPSAVFAVFLFTWKSGAAWDRNIFFRMCKRYFAWFFRRFFWKRSRCL